MIWLFSAAAAIGTVPAPFDCYLLNRGLKTLALRMAQHQKNGLAVAKMLEADPRVEKVLHPGECPYSFLLLFPSSELLCQL